MDDANSQSEASANRRPRWFRFSLRTMLVLVTVACVWTGVTINRGNRQRRAVDVIRKAGGTVRYDYEVDEVGGLIQKPQPQYVAEQIRRLVGIDYLDAAVRVDILTRKYTGKTIYLHGEKHFDDSAFDALVELPRTRCICIVGPDISDSVLFRISRLCQLRSLLVSHSAITDAGWKSLKPLASMTSLRLDGQNITDAAIANIEELTGLTQLSLTGARITDAGLRSLSGLTKLEELSLYRDKRVIEDRRKYGELRHQYAQLLTTERRPIDPFDYGPPLTDACLKHLKMLTHLKTLDITGSQITSAGIEDLKQSLPNLKVVGP